MDRHYIVLMGPWGSTGPVPAESYGIDTPKEPEPVDAGKARVTAIFYDLAALCDKAVYPDEIRAHPVVVKDLCTLRACDWKESPLERTEKGLTFYDIPLVEDATVPTYELRLRGKAIGVSA